MNWNQKIIGMTMFVFFLFSTGYAQEKCDKILKAPGKDDGTQKYVNKLIDSYKKLKKRKDEKSECVEEFGKIEQNLKTKLDALTKVLNDLLFNRPAEDSEKPGYQKKLKNIEEQIRTITVAISPEDTGENRTKYINELVNSYKELEKRKNENSEYADKFNEIDQKIKKEKKELNEAITSQKQLILSPLTEEEKKSEYKKALDTLRAQLSIITDAIPDTDKLKPLILSFNDYDPYFFKFNLGYEYLTIDDAFQEGFPRIGFMVYHRSKGNVGYHQSEDEKKCFIKNMKFHFFGGARITSSAEQDTTKEKESSSANGSGDQKGRNTLECDINLFVPIWEFPLGKYDSHLGPIFSVGGMKTDGIDHIDGRYYAGLRKSINPELYMDIMYGRTESLKSQRLEVRAQLPVYRFTNGSRVFLGTATNIGLDSKKHDHDEGDVLRAYVSWNVDFSKIWTALAE